MIAASKNQKAICLLAIIVLIPFCLRSQENMKMMNQYQIAETSYGEVRYAEKGPEDEKVVLFSTGGGVGFNSVHAFEWLASKGFRLICINRPGYYDLPIDTTLNLDYHADVYHEVLISLGITEKVHVFGVSMGGLSALYYAQKYPTKSLVIWS